MKSMITKEIIFKIPIDVSTGKIKEIVAVQLFKEGQVTLKHAAEIAELSIWDFLLILGQYKVSYTNIDKDDLKEELEGY